MADYNKLPGHMNLKIPGDPAVECTLCKAVIQGEGLHLALFESPTGVKVWPVCRTCCPSCKWLQENQPHLLRAIEAEEN